MPYICVHCGGPLDPSGEALACHACSRAYPAQGGVPVLLPYPDRHIDATRKALLAERMALALDQMRANAPGARHERLRAAFTARIANIEAASAPFFRAYRGTATADPAAADFVARARTGWSIARLIPYFIADWGDCGSAASVTRIIADEALHSADRQAALVIGAGAGKLVTELAGSFAVVTGIDLSLPAMLWAQDLLHGGDAELRPEHGGQRGDGNAICIGGSDRGPGNAGFAVADAGNLPFADGSQSLVVTQYLLDIAVDPAGIAGEVHRVLAPGGVWVNVGLPFRLPGDSAGADRWSEEDMHAFAGLHGFELDHAEARVLPHLDLSAFDPAWNGEVHRVVLFRARKAGPAQRSRLHRSALHRAAVPHLRSDAKIEIEETREIGAQGATFKIRLGKSGRAMMSEADSCRLVEALVAAIDGTRCVDEILAATSGIAAPSEALIVLEELLVTGQIELGDQRTA
ncbi:methyltransferase domain-containing protein [Novosphingobium sp.]|uniref:methyltransferase domain-containing protein n=1 Tax=Novosphingobium sp. TaxID=1874826 RepID=UPI00286E3D8A|nr:methyltransferase domain-containing protein [Novosphingobium sp.]